MLEWIHNIDAQILLFIQQYLRSDLFTWLWKGITFLGDGGWFWIVLGAALSFSKEDKKGRCNRTSGTSYRGSGYEFMP